MKQHLPILLLCFCIGYTYAQDTDIKGFAHAETHYTFDDDQLFFAIGEQDLFITSDISDRISFIGETVFKFSTASPTKFDVSVERIIIKYNFKGNHNLLIGKHHTPISYWNKTYHHGRVFFPTVDRPMIFSEHVVELHTTGIGLQGLNFGKMNFGYEVMVGNGIGSTDVRDNNKFKSLMGNLHIRPKDGMEVGVSAFYDQFPQDIEIVSDSTVEVELEHLLGGVYLAWFTSKFEFLTEGYFVNNDNALTGSTSNVAFYGYAGARFKKVVPYIRYDFAHFDEKEVFFHSTEKQTLAGGIRYEFNYKAVVKLEYNHRIVEGLDSADELILQFAVGF